MTYSRFYDTEIPFTKGEGEPVELSTIGPKGALAHSISSRHRLGRGYEGEAR